MHDALQLPEIVHAIAAQLIAWPSQKRTLVSFALACRAFEDPALDELWREPGEKLLERLLGCFPDGIFDYSITQEKLAVRLHRPVTLRDWERPFRYCRRVRRWVSGYDTTTKYSPVLNLFVISLPAEFLFPRLESLHWDASNPAAAAKKREAEAMAFLRILVSPSLKYLHVNRPSGMRLVLSVLPIVSTRARLLTHVYLGSGRKEMFRLPVDVRFELGCSTGERLAISDFVLSLDRLEEFAAPAIDARAFLHLATLPDLRKLRLETCLDAVPDPPRLTETFACLSTFCVALLAMPAAIRLLPLIADAPLHKFRFTPIPSTTTEELADFYAKFAANPIRQSLRSLTQLDREGEDADPNWIVSKPVFLAITALSQLTTLQLCSPTLFDVDELGLLSLARALPHLETLSLSQSSTESRIQLDSLVRLAPLCPRLECLELTLREPPERIPLIHPHVTGLPHERRRSAFDRLGGFSAGHTLVRADQVFDVARFLSGLMPRLDQLVCAWGAGLPGERLNQEQQICERWIEVSRLVGDLHEVRREEVEWAGFERDHGMDGQA
ncbi:hypothetical protein HMN09_00575100 [Mycena chlorophos]|uniref:F-box domain-containing protein n=1 Tax=Mycena chlorophos TaxID=658473 RepID=A0A8H6T944_MYCCL|nr:hypothetical protein HMN09_00575100 [Mycena chlorophos]